MLSLLEQPMWRLERRREQGSNRVELPMMVSEVDDGPALVVTTPGAEPRAAGGYGAALLLDSWALLGRQDLRAAEDTLRRWMAAAALVRPGSSPKNLIRNRYTSSSFQSGCSAAARRCHWSACARSPAARAASPATINVGA